MATKKESVASLGSRTIKGGWSEEKSVVASDLAGRTKVSSAKVAMAFDKASRSTGAFTSKYAK